MCHLEGGRVDRALWLAEYADAIAEGQWGPNNGDLVVANLEHLRWLQEWCRMIEDVERVNSWAIRELARLTNGP